MPDEHQDQEQIATWITADGSRPYCARPWKQITVLSDGTAVCACIDAAKTNPLGNVIEKGFSEVWNGEQYRKLRQDIEEDIDRTPICRGCPNRIVEGPPAGYHDGVPKPRVLFLESYAGCNLACPGCNREDIEGTRTDLSMDYADYTRLIDDLSPSLQYMEFHVGGENWKHHRAADMVRYCKDKNPECIVLSSTNGHFFDSDKKAREAVESGVDCLIISVDGATQESFQRYRVRGEIDVVFDGMRRLSRIKKELGVARPFIVWRYILFAWNSSDEEMNLARRLAKEVGADELTWHLNAAQEEFSSPRYYIGSPHLKEIKDELWDTFPDRVGWNVDLGLHDYR